MPTAFGTKIPGQLVTSAWANLVGSSINAIEDGNAMSLSQILAKYTGTPNGTKFLRDDGSWQNATTTDASALTSGTLPLARLSGITTTELSASAGIVSGQIAGLALSKLSAGTLATPLALGSQAVNQTGATIFTLANAGGLYLYSNVGTAGYQFYVQASDGTVQIGKTGAGNTLYNGTHTVSHFCKTNGGHYFYDNSLTLIGYYQADGSAMMGRQNVTSITTLTSYAKIFFSSTEKHRFSSTMHECDRLSLGGTVGSSVDPGAGGLALTGTLTGKTSATYANDWLVHKGPSDQLLIKLGKNSSAQPILNFYTGSVGAETVLHGFDVATNGATYYQQFASVYNVSGFLAKQSTTSVLAWGSDASGRFFFKANRFTGFDDVTYAAPNGRLSIIPDSQALAASSNATIFSGGYSRYGMILVVTNGGNWARVFNNAGTVTLIEQDAGAKFSITSTPGAGLLGIAFDGSTIRIYSGSGITPSWTAIYQGI